MTAGIAHAHVQTTEEALGIRRTGNENESEKGGERSENENTHLDQQTYENKKGEPQDVM
jgi:hypothetical protein